MLAGSEERKKMYYKLISEKNIFGAVSSQDFRRYSEKHGLILAAGEEHAQFCEYSGRYYTDDWLRPLSDGTPLSVASVDIVEISEDDYMELKAQLDEGEIPDDGSLDEEIPVAEDEPEKPETVQKTAAQILQEQIRLAARFAEV